MTIIHDNEKQQDMSYEMRQEGIAMSKNEKKEKLIELMKMSDLDFYDEFLADAPFEEQAEFFREFPEFLEKDAVGGDDLGKCDVKSDEIIRMAVNATVRK